MIDIFSFFLGILTFILIEGIILVAYHHFENFKHACIADSNNKKYQLTNANS